MAFTTRSHIDFFEALRTRLRLSRLRPEQVNSLTPAMVHAVSVLWMLAAAGRFDRHEVQVLPSLLKGGDLTLLHAINYVQSRSFEMFLDESPSLLAEREKFFILANLFEMMALEASEAGEEKSMFSTMMDAYAVGHSEFSVFEKVLGIKKNHPVLGCFASVEKDLSMLTPHVAFAASLLFTMVVSGKIEPGHVDRFQRTLLAFPGLQGHAVQYVKDCTLEAFLGKAAERISHEQKLFIFTNIVQLALHNGVLQPEKKKLLSKFRAAWAIQDDLHHLCFHTLAIQSIPPFSEELRHQLPSRLLEIREKHETLLMPPESVRGSAAAEEGIHWDREIRSSHDGGKVMKFSTNEARIPKEDASSSRRIPVDAEALIDHREKTAPSQHSDVNVQTIRVPGRADQRIQISKDSQLASASDASAMAGAMLHRWWSAMEDVLSRSLGLPESLRKSPRIRIPPIIHRKRIVDFSSIGIHLQYDGEVATATAPKPELTATHQYSYKLKTCISILRENIDLVNQKLNQLSPDQESS